MRPFAQVALLAAVVGALLAPVADALGSHAFYLAVHPRQCLVVPQQGGKTVLVVPCSDPAHNQEVYALGHGGWGHHAPPAYARAYTIAKSVCLSAYKRLTGRPLGANQGWSAAWPDPGAETVKYGDRIVCEYRAWPNLTPLGAGWHVR